MIFFLLLVILVLTGACIGMYFNVQNAKRGVQQAKQEIHRTRTEVETAVAYINEAFKQKVADLRVQQENNRAHYETENARAQAEIRQQLAAALSELHGLREYATQRDGEGDVRQLIAAALLEAEALHIEANAVLEKAKSAALLERKNAAKRAADIHARAQSVLQQAHRDASIILNKAETKALDVSGDAYRALREKREIDEALTAIRNTIEGYGDRYVIPTHSLLDELAEDFGHHAAGESLRIARENTRLMVEQGQAASSSAPDNKVRELSERFVTDAFNGRVDALLTTARHNNYGTLEQQIKDVYQLVNLNGKGIHQTRITSEYLASRLAELRWAVVTQELRVKEREEQRRIQEQIREEEKSRRDYERAQQEAAREEAAIKQALERARLEAEKANAEERAEAEARMAELAQKLQEAEAKNQRAISMAQQTRAGHVYIISNLGSFGDDVYKIGMTRRLDPLDRVRELGDASVPFTFDVHAMIYSDDAPQLERQLHNQFDHLRINKVNYRKEFFRLPLHEIRDFVSMNGLDATFTLAAEASEFRESIALAQMTPEQRMRYTTSADTGEGLDEAEE